MFNNLFTPIFGGKPDFFFGRKDLLARFSRALDVRGSEDRTLFITGTRGSGKTALIEQLSQRAQAAGWSTIDLTADSALQSFFRQIQDFDETSKTTNPHVEVKVLGSGGSASGHAVTKTSHFTADDMDVLFRRACEKAPKGFFVSVDEIQKVPLDDLSKICGAFQMASRKGYDVILAVAGLPYAYSPAIQHDGCTYLRRSVHEKLELFSKNEAQEAFLEAFRQVSKLKLKHEGLAALVNASSGHPYMMQLLGYHLIEFLNGKAPRVPYTVTEEDIETILPIARDAYYRRALHPLVDALGDSARAYLHAMAETMDEAHIAQTGTLAKHLGKSHQQLAPIRQNLLDEGIIAAPERGAVRFAIPYLRAFLLANPIRSTETDRLEEWDI